MRRNPEGYPLSNNYTRLWSLIREGYRVAGWVINERKSREEELWVDLVEIKWVDEEYVSGYMLGCPGNSWKSYEGETGPLFAAKSPKPLSRKAFALKTCQLSK